MTILPQLVPCPAKIAAPGASMPMPAAVSVAAGPELRAEADRLVRDLREIARLRTGGDGYPVRLSPDNTRDDPEGYTLKTTAGGAEISAAAPAGAFYGCQTLLQLLALSGGKIPLVEITDAPRYRVREVLVDMGRALYPAAMLRQIIRLLARLKLNTLHLHLFDDHLNSLRFDGTPLGSENPGALTVAELAALVDYAAGWHVAVIPEIEAWGHAGSIIHHYPQLYGGPGRWEGSSFGIGEELYRLLELMTDQVVAALPGRFTMHYGLDEANWALLPDAQNHPENYSPEKHVGRLYDILARSAEKQGKKAVMRIWADHGGRPIPEAIRPRVIVEPWMYFDSRSEDISRKVEQYGGAGKPPCMLGAGMSSIHFGGHFGATRAWCRQADRHPNIEGVDICIWETNDFPGQMIGVYGGAALAWNPGARIFWDDDNPGRDPGLEQTTGVLQKQMLDWVTRFPDADPAAMRAARGWWVYRGRYMEGPLRGRPVAPTVETAGRRGAAHLDQ